MAIKRSRSSVLPGFKLTLGYTLLYLSLIVLIPLAATFWKTSALTWDQFWHTVTAPRVMASYRLSFGASFLAALINLVFRPARRLGAGALPVLGQTIRGRAGGPAICAADGGGGHRVDRHLRAKRLDRPVACAAGHQSRLHPTGHPDCAHLHRVAVHCPHRATGAGGFRCRN